MPSWIVEFINDEAEVEFEALPTDIGARLTRILDLFAEKGLAALVMPLARPVEGKIWELRASGRDGIARSMYITASGRRMVILRTFFKKTQKTPRQEIEVALKRLKGVE
jgi:phage-related protein